MNFPSFRAKEKETKPYIENAVRSHFPEDTRVLVLHSEDAIGVHSVLVQVSGEIRRVLDDGGLLRGGWSVWIKRCSVLEDRRGSRKVSINTDGS